MILTSGTNSGEYLDFMQRSDNMKITKEELIEEISEQLKAIGLIAEGIDSIDLNQSIALFDLQFRLKCKLYELTKEG